MRSFTLKFKWTILSVVGQAINNKFHYIPLSLRAQTKLTATLSAARNQSLEMTLALPNESRISNFVLRAERVDTIGVVLNGTKIHGVISFISYMARDIRFERMMQQSKCCALPLG